MSAVHELDQSDDLAAFVAEFAKPPGLVYLAGSSLGLPSRPAEAALAGAMESWRRLGVLAWGSGPAPWFHLARQTAQLLAPLLGAEPDDVMIGSSTTVNLHQVLATWYDP